MALDVRLRNARVVGLESEGQVRARTDAFDPPVGVTATDYDGPARYSRWIECVLAGGEFDRDGSATGRTPGRVLRA